MVEFTEKGSGNVVHVIDNNIVRMSALAKGDQFYIPKNPTWLADAMGTNPNARARVLAIEIIKGGEPIVKPIYYNQLSRVDRETKKLVYSDAVNMAIHKGGNKAFDKLAAGKLLTVQEVNEEVNDFARDPNGNRLENEDKTPIFTKTKAFSFKVENAASIKDSDMQALIDAYIKENFEKVETPDAENNGEE